MPAKFSISLVVLLLPTLLPLSLTALIAGISGCLSEKTAYDNDVTYQSLSRNSRIGTREVQVLVELVTSEQQYTSGITVRASSKSSTDLDTTNSRGAAVLNLILEEDDQIDFFFTSEAAQLEWTETLRDIPKGVNKFKVTFEKDRLGRIRTIALEF